MEEENNDFQSDEAPEEYEQYVEMEREIRGE